MVTGKRYPHAARPPRSAADDTDQVHRRASGKHPSRPSHAVVWTRTGSARALRPHRPFRVRARARSAAYSVSASGGSAIGSSQLRHDPGSTTTSRNSVARNRAIGVMTVIGSPRWRGTARWWRARTPSAQGRRRGRLPQRPRSRGLRPGSRVHHRALLPVDRRPGGAAGDPETRIAGSSRGQQAIRARSRSARWFGPPGWPAGSRPPRRPARPAPRMWPSAPTGTPAR
jgi:hypothetical protein